MVALLSAADNAAIKQAISTAEKRTSAEMAAVIVPVSDNYSSFIMLYSLLTGSVVALCCWLYYNATQFPDLMAVQLGTALLTSIIPPFRRLCLCLVPKRIRHHRAARRAFEEYLRLSHHVAAHKPIVLLYVSLAERYVHILPSREIRKEIPTAMWENMVQEFTIAMPKHGVVIATTESLSRIADRLASHFPVRS